MRFFIVLLFCFPLIASSQSNKKIIKDIKKHVYFLASDQLEGRRTGTLGEKKAYGYILKQFKKNKISPPFELLNGFVQPFTFNEGLEIGKNNFIKTTDVVLKNETDFFPLPYSKCDSLVNFKNKNNYGFLDINTFIADSSNNPHFDLDEAIYQKLKTFDGPKELSIVFVFNSNDSVIQFKFDHKNKRDQLGTLLPHASDTFVTFGFTNKL